MKFKMALVTGGAGFIGSHIARRLLEKGMEVIVLDNFYMGKKEYIPEGARLIEADILNSAKLNQAFKGVDVVFHQAARVSIRNSIDNFYDDANVNIMGTVNVIQAVIKNKVKKMIYASSMAAYGDAQSLPIRESHSLNPVSPYGISKLTSEKYCLEMAKFFGFEAVSLRYFNTYGIQQTLTPYVGVITIFINRLLEAKSPVIFGDGKQMRDFVSVEDVAYANVLAMEKNGVSGEVFNIGSGIGRSVNEVAKLLIKHIDPSIKPEYGSKQSGEPSSSIADISKARRVLTFKPHFKLEDKIVEIIAWNKGLKK
jgi:UDP-glucose 4-epimerase